MGYITDLFISRIDHNLICGICAGVFKKPVVTHCGHTYCEECIKHWVNGVCVSEKTCPECRQEVNLLGTAPVLALRGLIEGLSVECQNFANGCKMVLKLGDMESHLKTCGYTLVECCSCRQMIPQIQFRQHQSKCVKLGNENWFDSHLKTEMTALQKELIKTKNSLQMAEETIRRLQRNLRDLRVKTRVKLNRVNDDQHPAWDSEYNYGYSPRSVIELSGFISRFLFERPPYVDPERIFTCLKRCYDYFRNSAAFWQDVHMLLATAAASDWFTDQQREILISWLKSLAREKLFLI